MELSAERYYRNSGAVPFAGTLLMIVLGMVAGAVLSFGYALLCRYNPLIYLTFLGTLVFGAGVGGAVRIGARTGKVRNRLFVIIVAAAISLISLYLTWVWYIWLLMRQMLPGFPVVFDPVAVGQFIQAIAEDGVWSMRGWEPTGWQLYAIWGVEALIVTIVGVKIGAGDTIPFCEPCNEWTAGGEQSLLLAYRDPAEVRRDLENERYEILDDLRREPADPANALHATIYRCPKCRDSNYLSVVHTVVATNRKGETETSSTPVVTNLRIPEDLVLHLESPAGDIETVEVPVAAGAAESEPTA